MFERIRKQLGPRLPSPAGSTSVSVATTSNSWPIQTHTELLQAPHRRECIKHIKLLTSVPDVHWTKLYTSLFDNYAALVQELPASEVHHHSHRGGMLDHTLDVVLNGLKLRRGYVLPLGATPERINPLAELYTYAVATSCLLHDIGKIACDQRIEISNQGHWQRWHPWHGPMCGDGYRMRFVRGRRYGLHEPMALLLAQQIVPPAGLSWLASEPEVLNLWVHSLTGDPANGGIIHEIVSKADGASVARNLGANTGKAVSGAIAAKPLHQKILTSLKFLLHEGHLAINRRGAAGWLTANGLWLVSKTVADAIRAQLLTEGHDGIPSQNPRLFEIMQEHGLLVPVSADRAVWSCRVNDGEGWEHELTLLQIDPAQIWTADAKPPLWAGSITPVSEATPASENTATPPLSSHAETQTVPSSTPNDLPVSDGSSDANPVVNASHANSSHTEKSEEQTLPMQSTHSESAENVALAFVHWLKTGLQRGDIKLNVADAPCHIVNGGLFLVTPGVFKHYIHANPHLVTAPQETPATADALVEAVRALKKASVADISQENWQPIQRAFQKLKLHEKHKMRGENIWKCLVQGARKRAEIKGFFIIDPSTFLPPEKIKNNKYLTLLES